MDTWSKYKIKSYKVDLNTLSISKHICYSNYLLFKICWNIINGRTNQMLINKFFRNAAITLQASVAQKGYNNTELYEIFNYIDTMTKDLYNTKTEAKDLASMIGNMTEIENKYTFIETIAFVRAFVA